MTTGRHSTEVQNALILAGIRKVVTMLIPGGGFLNAIIGAFQSVQFVIQRGSQIASVIMSGLGSIGAIAAGNISGAAGLIERTMAASIPLALDFVGRLVGIGNLGQKIKRVIQKVRGRLDKLVDKLVLKVKGLIGKLKGGKDKKKTPVEDKKEHDAKVKIGLQQIQSQERTLAKDGKLSKKNARKIARDVLSKNKVFRNIKVVDGGNHWRFHWFASEGIQEGIAKLATSMESYPIEFKCKKSLDYNEFVSQILIQESKLRSMSISAWMTQRDNFFQRIVVQKARGVKKPQGRDPEGDAMAQKIRAQAIIDMATDLVDNGEGRETAITRATLFYKDKAAIHRLDQVAGGDGTDFVGMGDARVDFSIGAAWRTRAIKLQKHIESSIDPDYFSKIKMNVNIVVKKG